MYHHHHHVVPPARISLALPRHFSLSFIASGRSSGLHAVSSQSCCMYVLAGRPAFAWPYAGVHRSTSLMSSSLLLQQCPACLVRLVKSYWEYEFDLSLSLSLSHTHTHTHTLSLSLSLSLSVYIYIYMITEQIEIFNLGMTTGLEEGKILIQTS